MTFLEALRAASGTAVDASPFLRLVRTKEGDGEVIGPFQPSGPTAFLVSDLGEITAEGGRLTRESGLYLGDLLEFDDWEVQVVAPPPGWEA